MLRLSWVVFAAWASMARADFKMQEIANDLTVGYAVSLVDVNHDGKLDIVVVDSQRVIWYENPTWKMRPILRGKTKPDNVCISPIDIDGDGKVDFVLGADWKPFNTRTGGTLHWLKRGNSLDDDWTLHPIGEEPTVHRVRVADIDGDGKPEILLAPLMGRDSTKERNWMDGRPVRLLAYSIPRDPVAGPWTPKVLSEELHVMHNFHPVARESRKVDILTASYEGVSIVQKSGDSWITTRKGLGNQTLPMGSRGASEIKMGKLAGNRPVIATIEPWHGNEVVVYTQPKTGELWDRHVIDQQLRWGHAVWFADLDGDGSDELIVGVRDNPAKGDTFMEKRGVRIYKADPTGAKWTRQLLDPDGVAVEDLAAADLDGDGRIDIVAVGRATRNARIYWNRP